MMTRTRCCRTAGTGHAPAALLNVPPPIVALAPTVFECIQPAAAIVAATTLTDAVGERTAEDAGNVGRRQKSDAW
jgi:hypothetical protein